MMKRPGYSLGFKFSLAMGGLLVLFCALLSFSLYEYLKSRSIQDAIDKTQIIMTHTKALGGYVRNTLRPKMYDLLRKTKSEEEFIIEAMSTTHVNHQVMRQFNRDLPGYEFRRTSNFPLNPANSANDYEAGMIRYFGENPDVSFYQGVEKVGGKEILISVRPVVSDSSCLWCHGSPDTVPRAVKERYGEESRFGWTADAVIGVESVNIPLDVAFSQVRRFSVVIFLFGFLALLTLFAGLYLTFTQLVTRPLQALSGTFHNIVEGKEALHAERGIDRSDEIGDLTASFDILARHLHDAQEKLRRTAALEKQMMQTEKMAALGQLSAGVAHEINNPLGGIKLCFNNLLATKMNPDMREEHIQLVNDGLDRIQKIVRQLLDYSKNSPLSTGTVSLNPIIEKVLHLTDYIMEKKGIRLESTLAEDLPDISGDADKLEQVLLNITLNAIQVVRPGGSIHIRTGCENGWCVVGITDTGPGIPMEVFTHIFDPFFTTKDVGEGTGLGLTISKAIVEQHRGVIEVETSSAGTVFRVKIPIGMP